MAHCIENMFSVEKTPWHKLGSVVQEAPSIADGIKLAGLDWEVFSEPVYTAAGQSLETWAKRFYRSSDGKTLGIVGPKTYPLQNIEAFKFFEPFLDSGLCELHTAGSLYEGQKVWVLAKVKADNSEIVKGDEVAKFVLVSNSHDGSTAVRVGFTPIRVVCANTLALAHGDKASKLIRARHSKDVKNNLEKIREVMNVANAEFEATAEQFRRLASKNINQADLRKYLVEVFDMDTDKDGRPESTRSKNILEEVVKLFETGKGNTLPGVAGTAWAAYNSVTEYLNYSRGNSDDSRMNSLWFGDSMRVNANALEKALALAV